MIVVGAIPRCWAIFLYYYCMKRAFVAAVGVRENLSCKVQVIAIFLPRSLLARRFAYDALRWRYAVELYVVDVREVIVGPVFGQRSGSAVAHNTNHMI